VNVASQNVDPLCGTIQSESLSRALIEGAEYIWNNEINGRGRVSLLWRTEIDDDSLAGASGSLLIQGRPGDPTGQCLLFQNYEAPLRSIPMDKDLNVEKDWKWATFKGGFLLPADFQQNAIVIFDDCPESHTTCLSATLPRNPRQETP
jgi:hypothetical protein